MIGGDDMLTIFDTIPLDDTSVIRDVEEAFSSFELKGDNLIVEEEINSKVMRVQRYSLF